MSNTDTQNYNNFGTQPVCFLEDKGKEESVYVCDRQSNYTALNDLSNIHEQPVLVSHSLAESFGDAVFQTGKAIGAISAYMAVNRALPYAEADFNAMQPGAVLKHAATDWTASAVFFSVATLGELNPTFKAVSGVAATAANIALQATAKDGDLASATVSSLAQTTGFFAGFEFDRDFVKPIFGEGNPDGINLDSHAARIQAGIVYYNIDSAVQGLKAFAKPYAQSFVTEDTLAHTAIGSGVGGFVDPLFFNLIYAYSSAASGDDVYTNVALTVAGSSLQAAAECSPFLMDPTGGTFTTCVSASLLRNAITASGFVASVYFMEDVVKPAYEENWAGQAAEYMSSMMHNAGASLAGIAGDHGLAHEPDAEEL
ncbi:MAG: hypothetical protein RLN62_05775 [Rickettsiales bacterium]